MKGDVNTMKRSKKWIGAVLAALTVSAALLAAPATASANEDDPLITQMETFLIEYGGSATNAAVLVKRFRAGLPIQAASSSSTPLAVQRYAKSGYNYTVSKYADGSIGVMRVQQPNPLSTGPSTFAISGCGSYTSGSESHRTNCLVDFLYGLVAMSFRADFTYVTPGNDRIDSVWGDSWSIGGACSTNRNYFGIQKKYEDASGPARARLQVQAQMCGIPYTTTFYLQLQVGAGGATFQYG